jgi:phage I-like protein
LSPALYQAKNDGRILGLHSVGLTNKPAIVGMPAIVNLEPAGSREDVVRAFGPVMSSPRHAILI